MVNLGAIGSNDPLHASGRAAATRPAATPLAPDGAPVQRHGRPAASLPRAAGGHTGTATALAGTSPLRQREATLRLADALDALAARGDPSLKASVNMAREALDNHAARLALVQAGIDSIVMRR